MHEQLLGGMQNTTTILNRMDPGIPNQEDEEVEVPPLKTINCVSDSESSDEEDVEDDINPIRPTNQDETKA